MVHLQEISVVVQGPIYGEYTAQCLQSIRENLPGAQIILSTWEGSNVDGLDYDDLVLSKDPGGVVSDDTTGAINNINRQLVSTCAGIEVAKGKYCLKFRSDMQLLGVGFLDYFDRYDQEAPAQYFSHRLIICNYFSRNPRIMPLPFHLTDWLAFGTLSDVKTYYSAPLQSAQESAWFRNRGKNTDFFESFICRFTPEQYICSCFIKKFQEIHCSHYYDSSSISIKETEELVARNFVILNYGGQLEVCFPKYNPNRYMEKYTLYSNADWRILYKKYCLNAGIMHYSAFCVKSKIWWLRSVIRRNTIKVFRMFGIKEKIKNLLGMRR